MYKITYYVLNLSIILLLYNTVAADAINTTVDYTKDKAKTETFDVTKQASSKANTTVRTEVTGTTQQFSNSAQQKTNNLTQSNANTKAATRDIKTGALEEYNKTKNVLSTFKTNVQQSLHPCFADNCKDIDGFVGCLKTNPTLGYFMRPENFFRKDPVTNEPIYKTVPVVIGIKKTAVNSTNESFEETQTIPMVIKLIHSKTYESFQRLAKENPNCIRSFCRANCMTLEKIDPKFIKAQARFFFISPVPININGRTYSTERLRDMSVEKRENLALGYLMDRRNTLISTFCLTESTGGVKLRMFCSQCPQFLHKGDIGLLNTTCTTFDNMQYVDYSDEPTIDPALQATLKNTNYQQQMTLQKAIAEAGNGLGAGVDLQRIKGNLSIIAKETNGSYSQFSGK